MSSSQIPPDEDFNLSDEDLEAAALLSQKSEDQANRRACIENDLGIFRRQGKLIEDEAKGQKWAKELEAECERIAQPLEFYLQKQSEVLKCADRLRKKLTGSEFPRQLAEVPNDLPRFFVEATILSDQTTGFLNQTRSVFGRSSLLRFDAPPQTSLRDRQEWQLNFLVGWRPKNRSNWTAWIAKDPVLSSRDIEDLVQNEPSAISVRCRPTWSLLCKLSTDGYIDDWIERLFAHQFFLHATEETLVMANDVASAWLVLRPVADAQGQERNRAALALGVLRELFETVVEARNIPFPKIHE